jgi:hypothetical protein
MAKNKSTDLQDRAVGALLSSAFFTWPSAVLIGVFSVLFLLNVPLFSFWQNWMWLVAGALSEAAYLYATLTDPNASSEAVSRMLTEKYDPRAVRNNNARELLLRALEYKKQIDRFVSEQSGAMRVSLAATASDINNWIGYIYDLAKHIDMFESNAIISRDRQNVPTEIANLKRRLSAETDPAVKAELEDAIRIKQNLLSQLTGVGNSAKRAEIRMESTISQLGTVYAQMQQMDAKDLDSGRAQRLKDDIREEIAQLTDTLSTMDDMYKQAGYNRAVTALADDDTDTQEDQTTSSAARRTGSTQR